MNVRKRSNSLDEHCMWKLWTRPMIGGLIHRRQHPSVTCYPPQRHREASPRISEGSCYLVNEPSFIGVTSTPNLFSEFLHLAVFAERQQQIGESHRCPVFSWCTDTGVIFPQNGHRVIKNRSVSRPASLYPLLLPPIPVSPFAR